jgi:hypothetical protein
MHIILVRVIHSIQNSYINYSTQSQHFAYSDNTNYNLNFYYFIVVSIYLWFHLFGNYSYVSDVSDDPDGILRAENSALFRRNSQNLRYRGSGWYAWSLAGARNHCEGSVGNEVQWTIRYAFSEKIVRIGLRFQKYYSNQLYEWKK